MPHALFIRLYRIVAILLVVLLLGSRLDLAQQGATRETEDGLERGEDPQRAAEWFYAQRAYPGNSLPQSYRFEAANYIRQRFGVQGSRPGPRFGLTTDRWQELGPNNVGGRILAVAIHPKDDNVVYVGGADGGVFKTIDGGQTWIALNDTLPSLAIASLVIDPLSPETVYAGTGEGAFNIDAAVGKGVLKTSDGGATWTVGPLISSYTNRLAIHPTQTGTLYAATRDGVFKTTDGAQSWTSVLAGRNCIDISLDPSNPQNVITSVWDRNSSQTTNGIWRTSDSGQTWVRVSSGLPAASLVGRIGLTRSLGNPLVVYAGVGQFSSSLPALGIFKSVDGGQAWSQLPGTPSYCGSQCWYDNELAVDPVNPEVLFASGLNLYVSRNGGTTWARSDVGVHVDHHAIAISPRNPNVIYNGNDGGMYRSDDGGKTWSVLNQGLSVTQFYALAMSATDPSLTYGGTQDNGTQKGSGAPSFQQVLGGDGMVALVDYSDPNYVYAESQNGGLARSTNGGISYAGARTGIISTDRFNWVTPWIIDPVDPRTLYVGSHRLYRSLDRAVSWIPISSDLTRGSSTISTIAVAPSDRNVLYAGTADGMVWTATDGGASLSSFRPINSGLPNRYVTRLRAHPRDARSVYATFSGFNSAGGLSGHVFKSTDGGESWRNISSDLPDLPVQVMVVDPIDPNTLFIGTDLGCFRSRNDGASWEPFNDGLPNVVVDDMNFFGNTHCLRVATHGRGMWQYITGGRSPSSLRTIVGDNMRVAAGADVSFPVRVVVLDAEGSPVPEVSVSFEVQASLSRGTFADGSGAATVMADMFGVALLPTLRLNGSTGSFTVRATAAGVVSPANIAINSISTAPQLLSVEPESAVAGQVIISGQNVFLTGSGFSSPFFVYYIQNGTWYATTSNTSASATTGIYSTIPSGLAPGKASIVVSRNGEVSNGATITITRLPTPPTVKGVMPSAPSPGQQFLAMFSGQLFFSEQFTLTQSDARYTGIAESVFFGSASFTMPAFPFAPGGARLAFGNVNSPSSSTYDYSIPSVPAAPILNQPASRAPEQLISLSGLQFGFSSVAQFNKATFSQGGKVRESTAVALSGGNIVVSIPSDLVPGPAEVRVQSLFANGPATSDPVSLTIGSPPSITTPSFSPAAFAPGARATVTSTTTGAFNTNPSRNRILVRSGGTDYTILPSSVSTLGTTLSFTVPEGLSAGPATGQVTSDFGNQSVVRVQNSSLTINPIRHITPSSGENQTADSGQTFGAALTVRVTESNGAPVANATVTFTAPTSGPSGFFEIGGVSTTTPTTNTQGFAVAPAFKASNNGGIYYVRATLSGQPGAAVFSMRNRNLSEKRELELEGHAGQLSVTAGAEAKASSGYASVTSAGKGIAGASIFSVRDSAGNLITEAAVPDSVAVTSSLMFVDTRAGTLTGLAMVNSNDSAATVTLRLFNPSGVAQGDPQSLTLNPKGQTARFLYEIFGTALPQDFIGTVAVTSAQPVAAVTLRARRNDRGETIYSALPVASSSGILPGVSEICFPHMAMGSGYRTSILLMNPTQQTLKGKLRLFDAAGSPLAIAPAGSEIAYSISPNGHFLFESANTSGSDLKTGYAVAVADTAGSTPVGSLFFSSYKGGTLVSEAAVPASLPMTHALAHVDTQSQTLLSDSETRSTGIAIANRGSVTAKVRFTLRNSEGSVVGIPKTMDLLPGQQIAQFVNELMGAPATNLRGALEVRSDRTIELLTLRGTLNNRNEFIYTTIPIADYEATPKNSLLFAHFADGGGFSTLTVLLNPSEGSTRATIRFTGPGGEALKVDLQ